MGIRVARTQRRATRIPMRFIPRLIHPLVAGSLFAIGCLQPCWTGAQTPTPSAEELELLRNLTPEQRAEILRQVPDDSRARSDQERIDTSREDSTRERSTERRSRDLTEEEEEENQRGVPVLKGNDTVIIRIDLPQAPQSQTIAPVQPAAPGGQNTAPQAQGPQMGVVPGTPNRGTTNEQLTAQRVLELSEEERQRLGKLIELVRSRNPYRLSPEGVLELPGFAGIPLAGLTEFQATIRLLADPELRGLYIALIRLPLKKIGTEALKPFGYDLFDHAPSTFAPVTNIPVPADYVIGPGDELEVQLYGNQNRTLRLVVGRDGRVNFPELGPISVGGQPFTNVKEGIESRIARQMIGVHASVSMGDTRAIRVFVLGEVRRPGSYTISGLGTMASALFAAGGVKPIGSLRNIQLRRQGALVRSLDLYDMLIRGNTKDVAKVLPGDVVFVPPVGPTVTVIGEVQRPAIYEVKRDLTTVADLVELAGGLTPQADTMKAALTRIDENQKRVVLEVELTLTGMRAPTARNGDILSIARLKPTLDSGVVVEGYVYSPATYAFRDGLRLSDVIRSVDELKPNADLHYVLIRRELPTNREITVISADLGAALAQPKSKPDLLLMQRDRITVFDLESGRDRIIRPLMNELRLQANMDRPTETVTVDGKVKVPGEYPLESGMTVSDLIRAGGGLGDSAWGSKAELTRYRVEDGDTRRTELIEVDLAAVLRGDAGANMTLLPFDSLSIKETPEWGKQENVTLTGEFRFPGRYSIRRGETMRSVIARAGGLTDYAFAEGSVFTREELREREQKQLDLLASRVQNDLGTLALQAAAANQAGAGTALTVGQSLLEQLRASKAVGRLVIDLPRAIQAQPGSSADIILRDGDRLIVPRIQQEVTVMGEVQTTTSHLYADALTRDDYISQSGGVTQRADESKIYVVRANGSVVANEGGRWFSRGGVDIKPGDTIVVPLDTERLPALPFWQAVTQILYNVAIAIAAINSF